jgi:hypothetical protein
LPKPLKWPGLVAVILLMGEGAKPRLCSMPRLLKSEGVTLLYAQLYADTIVVTVYVILISINPSLRKLTTGKLRVLLHVPHDTNDKMPIALFTVLVSVIKIRV